MRSNTKSGVGDGVRVGWLVGVTLGEGVDVGVRVGVACGIIEGLEVAAGRTVGDKPDVFWGVLVIPWAGTALRQPAVKSNRRRQRVRVNLEV